MANSDIPVKEISELLDTVSDKVPSLVKKLLATIYSQEAATEMGRAVGSLYKELTASGIPEDMALKMAADYMISLKDILKNTQQFQTNSSKSTSIES